MVILGLTGSIGMGKTTAAGMLRSLDVPVHDSDAAVHRLMAPGGAAIAAVEAAFPGVVTGAVKSGAVDRAALGRRVFGDAAALRRLEAILHPLVHVSQARFLARAAARRETLAVLDIPLLFEIGGDRRCDAVVVVSAPRFLQESRVLSRPGATRETLARVRTHQMTDAEKRRRADFVVPTGGGRALTLRRLKEIVTLLRSETGRHWPPPAYATKRSIYARNRPRHRDHGARSERRP